MSIGQIQKNAEKLSYKKNEPTLAIKGFDTAKIERYLASEKILVKQSYTKVYGFEMRARRTRIGDAGDRFVLEELLMVEEFACAR